MQKINSKILAWSMSNLEEISLLRNAFWKVLRRLESFAEC